jgi:penicillin-binding protein 2
MEGMHDATSGTGGTATDVFGEFPIQIAGKTGTAERCEYCNNQAWFISLAPYPNPNVVTVVTVEEGGFGAESAAPANKEILEAYFHHDLEKENEEKTEEAEEGYEEEFGTGEEARGGEEELPLEETGEGG